MNTKQIETLIADMSISDIDVQRAAEKIPFETDKKEKEEILALLKEKRPALYNQWQHEVAVGFMQKEEKTPSDESLKCEEEGCGGTVDITKATLLKTGCISVTPAFMCNICGRLHWYNEGKVFGVKSRQGEKAFGIKPEE